MEMLLNDLPRHKLREMVVSYGRDIYNEPQRCKSFLLDTCGEYKREISILVTALDERVPADLLTSSTQVPYKVLQSRFAKRLYENRGLTEDFAQWGVDSWALALGLIAEKDLLPPPRPSTQPIDIVSTTQPKPPTQPVDNASTKSGPRVAPSPPPLPTRSSASSVSRRLQIVPMITGTAIYGIFDFIVGLILKSAYNSGNSSLFTSIGSSPYSPSLYGILIGLTLTIFFFFGAEFGPWVGLVSALVGSLLGDFLSGYLSTFQIPWYTYVGTAVAGFVPGLALRWTHGLYNNRRAIAIAVAMSAIGLVINNIVVASGDAITFQISFFNDFLSLTLSFVVSLILLPILLVIYNAGVTRRKLTSTKS